jgi:hypothetical protein
MAKKKMATKLQPYLAFTSKTVTTASIMVTGTVANPNNPVTCVLTFMDTPGPPPPASMVATHTGATTWTVTFSGAFAHGAHYLFAAMAPAEGSSCTVITIP